jgi:N-acyl-D-amino-acid deacylase
VLSVAILGLLTLLPAAEPALQADIVIRGATLYDGTGQPGRKGDVAIRGERIVAVGNFAVGGKPHVIDCSGLIVPPGLIDLHTHSDTGCSPLPYTSDIVLP